MAGPVEPTPIGGIRVLTLGSVPRDLAQDLAVRVSARVSVPCRLAPAISLDLPVLELREQVDADRLLRMLEKMPVAPGEVLLGITERDIGNPIFSFYFGVARQNGAAALVSLARLRPAFYGLPVDPELTLRRAILEILHELGHVGGLHHCGDYRCVMHFASTVETIDNRGETFCASCASALPRGLRPPSRATPR